MASIFAAISFFENKLNHFGFGIDLLYEWRWWHGFFKKRVVVSEDAELKKLIDQIVAGSQDAFSSLYLHFLPRLYSYLRLQINHDNDIQDLMQDVFIAIWKNANKYTGTSTVTTWIFGIARHKLLDWMKSKKRYSQKELQWLDDLDNQSSAVEGDFANRLVNQQLINEALSRIPPQFAELIYLVFVESMSYKEISFLLEVPEGTVKSRMHQAKAHLRKQLIQGGLDLDRTV